MMCGQFCSVPLESDMKSFVFVVSAALFAALLAPDLLANKLEQYRADADQHYQQHRFKKAYKIYYKMAKVGDHYAQDRVAQIYANGEGRSINLTEAYAWSVLAAESGDEQWVNNSGELLQRTDDKIRAQKRATKLKKRYGKRALKAKADRQTKRDSYKTSGRCTGSHLSCAGG